MSHSVPNLPYDFGSLEPTIDARTMEIHHDKHHAAYVSKLNEALSGHPKLAEKPVEPLLREIDRVPEDIRTKVRNHGGGHANHTLFWQIMAPGAGGEPEGVLADALADKFGSFASFREKFGEAAANQFGSGWGWLVVDASGSLDVYALPNQDSPLMKGHTPLLGLDVWEHAYYLKYQNRRPDYIKAWWDVVNWEQVGRNYDKAK
ncbi:MAG TPA: superoxide dismutase [Longimicrobiales bacterium]|nr:superoxide dismutase [Longimicrobiales bacterium]